MNDTVKGTGHSHIAIGFQNMSHAYVVGHITVKSLTMWDEYRSKVPETLAAWGGELVFRGKQVAVLSVENPHPDIVVVPFPTVAAGTADWEANRSSAPMADSRRRPHTSPHQLT